MDGLNRPGMGPARAGGEEGDRWKAIPAELNWQSLLSLDGDALETHYRHVLAELGKGPGLIPVIFRKA